MPKFLQALARRTDVLRCCGLLLALLAGGCSAALEATTTAPPSMSPAAAPPPDPEPPYRTLIAEHFKTMFAEDAQMREVSISGARRVATIVGRDWLVCLRGIANSAAGGSNTRTYAIFINKRNEIVDRRLAEAKDGCDQERFQPLAAAAR